MTMVSQDIDSRMIHKQRLIAGSMMHAQRIRPQMLRGQLNIGAITLMRYIAQMMRRGLEIISEAQVRESQTFAAGIAEGPFEMQIG